MNTKEIIKNAIDLHVHIGPEIIPRKFKLPNLIKYEKGKIKAIAVKNHFFPTVFADNLISSEYPFIIHSVALNLSNGGFNPEVVRASCELAKAPVIVWFPTIHAKNFLEKSNYEIAPEWVGGQNFEARKANSIKGLYVLDDKGNLKPEVIEVLNQLIKKHGKPREILSDNGNVYGLTSEASKFDIWCRRNGIKHIRSAIHSPTTTGKVERLFQTMDREMPFCNNDSELFRMRYNHFRPHTSLYGKSPADIYFAFYKLFLPPTTYVRWLYTI